MKKLGDEVGNYIDAICVTHGKVLGLVVSEKKIVCLGPDEKGNIRKCNGAVKSDDI